MSIQAKTVLVLLFAAGFMGSDLLAQSADAQPNDPPTTKSTTDAANTSADPKAEASSKPSKDQAATTKDKAFVPSEEISEDFAVSFPVDI